MVSQASKFEKKELDSRGEDRGGGERTDDGETFWLPVPVGSFVGVPGCASWVSKGGRFAKCRFGPGLDVRQEVIEDFPS